MQHLLLTQNPNTLKKQNLEMEECFFWYLSYFITRVRYFINTSLTIGSALLNILRRYEMKNTCREHVKIVFSLDAFAEY